MIDLEKYVSGSIGNVKTLTTSFLTYPEVIEHIYGDVLPGTKSANILLNDFCERYNIYYVTGTTDIVRGMIEAEESEYEYFLIAVV